MNVKRFLKKLLKTTAILHGKRSSMDVRNAEKILESFSPNPATTCISSNTLDIQYDLHIIIPAYNTGKYIAQCLESVLSQNTRYSFFVTVVNDGSVDNTLDIVRSYQEEYPERMEVINQGNQGLSGARNVALRVIKGKYITFIDSDDVLVEGAVETMLRAAIENESWPDIIQGGWYEGVELGEVHNVCVTKQLSGFPWGKLYKAEILQNFQFPEKYWFEDTPISFIIHRTAKDYKIISDIIYGYRLNPEGISAKSSGKKRSVESYYITKLCLHEFGVFNVPYDVQAYEYFLRQCLMNWNRSAELPKKIREAIFVLEAELREKYFADLHSDSHKEIELALKRKQFNRFEIIARSVR